MKQVMLDTRQLSVAKLYEIRETNLTNFQNIVRNMFQGRFSEVTRERLLTGKRRNHTLALQLQQEYIAKVERKAQRVLEDIELEKKFIEKKEAEYEEYLEAFRVAEKKLKLAEETLNAARTVLSDFERKCKNCQEVLETERKNEKELEVRVLLHPSATLQQIKDHQGGIFVATYQDSNILSKIGCVDRIFEAKDGEFCITNIPHSITKADRNEEEIISLVDYANMVINYYLEGKYDFVPVFSSEEIAELLRANGYEY